MTAAGEEPAVTGTRGATRLESSARASPRNVRETHPSGVVEAHFTDANTLSGRVDVVDTGDARSFSAVQR